MRYYLGITREKTISLTMMQRNWASYCQGDFWYSDGLDCFYKIFHRNGSSDRVYVGKDFPNHRLLKSWFYNKEYDKITAYLTQICDVERNK